MLIVVSILLPKTVIMLLTRPTLVLGEKLIFSMAAERLKTEERNNIFDTIPPAHAHITTLSSHNFLHSSSVGGALLIGTHIWTHTHSTHRTTYASHDKKGRVRHFHFLQRHQNPRQLELPRCRVWFCSGSCARIWYCDHDGEVLLCPDTELSRELVTNGQETIG